MKLDRSTFVEVIKNTPLVSIDLIARNAKGEVLLGLRSNEPAKNYWFVPGGRIRKNELIADAFERIARSELGIESAIGNAKFLGVFEHLYQANYFAEQEFGTHYVVLGHEIELQEPLHLLSGSQHRNHRWWKVKDLVKAQDVHQYTKDYFKK